MPDPRPTIPSDVKRRLRQEAGFGCCTCGHPFIEYHHIVPWAEDQHFRPEDMMVLCASCHHLCTVGAITESEQRREKLRPKNIVDNMTRGQLFANSSELTVNLGGGKATRTPELLTFSGRSILSANLERETGRVLVSAVIQDSAGNEIAKITNNEWSMIPGDVWDFEVFPCHAKVRQGPKDIAFSVDTRNGEIDLRGKWYHRGQIVEFNSNELRFGNTRYIGLTVDNCGGMFAIG